MEREGEGEGEREGGRGKQDQQAGIHDQIDIHHTYTANYCSTMEET